ncbi:hypothetical protein RUND412_006017 [Rhizina undulata]
MTRGNVELTRVFYKGTHENFVIFVESEEDLKRWKKDSSIPLAQVVRGFKVFITHKQGAQGILDGASNAILDAEFGTHDEEEVIKKIMREGKVEVVTNPERQGITNPTEGLLGVTR